MDFSKTNIIGSLSVSIYSSTVFQPYPQTFNKQSYCYSNFSVSFPCANCDTDYKYALNTRACYKHANETADNSTCNGDERSY